MSDGPPGPEAGYGIVVSTMGLLVGLLFTGLACASQGEVVARIIGAFSGGVLILVCSPPAVVSINLIERLSSCDDGVHCSVPT